MTINGQPADSVDRLPVYNPARGEAFGSVPAANHRMVDLAVSAARRASFAWRIDEGARRQFLHSCGDAIARTASDLAHLLTREQGKTRGEARAEVDLSAHWFHTVAELTLPQEILRGNTGAVIEVRREPYGVVAAITPANFPVILAVCKIAPALLAGNTVVLKPSPHAPMTALFLTRILADVLPAGVLNTISGGHDLGAALVTWPGIDMLSFTGSVPVGKEIAAAAGSALRHVVLELGGNDPAIVLPGSNIEEIVEALYGAAFANAGQFCVAIKRLYAHRSLAGELLGALEALAAAAIVGDGVDPGTTMGPLTTPAQLDLILGQVSAARARGARIVHGGERLNRPGNFMRPTLVAEVEDDFPIVAEEQFGPALPILVYDDIEEAIERANRTTFGLGGSVWGPDPEEAVVYAARLECGTCWVNDHAVFHPLAPFGGHKWSGLGYEYGPVGLAEFLRYKVVHRPGGRFGV